MDRPCSPYMSHLVQVLLLEGELFPAKYGVCWSLPLAVSFMWLVGLSSGVVQSPPLVMLVWGPLGLGSIAGRLQMLCVTSLSYLSGAIMLFSVCGCVCWALVCVEESGCVPGLAS